MSEQLALYSWLPTPGRARTSDPWTSHLAAHSITPGSSEGRILDALRFGPLTHEELGQVLAPSLPATITTACSRLSKPDVKTGRPALVHAVGSKLNSRRREVLVWALIHGGDPDAAVT